jgi:tetratricopeptide (TPR) repeat protein
VVESSDHPERAEPYADRLRGAMPAAGHLVHMPSHIYYRVGRYLDALAANKAAVAADEAYLARSGAPMGVYRLGYYPHNIHFLMAAAAMAGDGPTALAAAEQLRRLIPDDAAQEIEVAEPVKAAPYFAHAQFSPPEAILALPDPGDDSPYVKAIWHYARGLAHASRRDAPAAAAEANAIERIERTADFSRLNAANIPAQDILKLARAVIEGRIAQALGDLEVAAERFKEAAAIQDSFPYMEPPAWYYPVRQTLAVVLMQSGRLDEAEDQFRRAQKRAPNSGWIYYGLSKLYRMRGDVDAARWAERALGKTWIGDRSFLQLPRL